MQYKRAFFKYKPLATVDEIKNLSDILEQKIWMQRVSDLNDPFEGRFIYNFLDPTSLETNSEIFQNYLNCLRNNGEENLSEEEAMKRLVTPEVKEALKDCPKPVANFFQDHGVLSLTSCPSNIPMWAHYGNYHNGYCLIFEMDFSKIVNQVPISFQQEYMDSILDGESIISFSSNSPGEEKFEFAFFKIKYKNKLPYFFSEEYLKLKDQYSKIEYEIKNSIGVKFCQWEYENEYRLVVNQNSLRGGLLDLRVHAPFLTVVGVIMGQNFGLSSILEKMCEANKIDLYMAKCSDEEYRINLIKILDNGCANFLESICKCGCKSSLIAASKANRLKVKGEFSCDLATQ